MKYIHGKTAHRTRATAVLIVALCIQSIPHQCSAQQSNQQQQQQKAQQQMMCAADQKGANDPSKPTCTPTTRSFGGLTLGVGLGLILDAQRQHRIISAAPVNNVVRITETSDATQGSFSRVTTSLCLNRVSGGETSRRAIGATDLLWPSRPDPATVARS